MDTIVQKLDRWFCDGPVTRDEAGYLAELAALFGEPRPMMLFVAGADGAVLAADDLGSRLDLRIARDAAAVICPRLRSEARCVAATDVEGRSAAVFGLRLSSAADSDVLGAIFAPGPSKEIDCQQVAQGLVAGGRIATIALRAAKAA